MNSGERVQTALVSMTVDVKLQYLIVMVFVLEVQNLMLVVVVVEHIPQNKYEPIHLHFEPNQNMVLVPHHHPTLMQYLLYLCYLRHHITWIHI